MTDENKQRPFSTDGHVQKSRVGSEGNGHSVPARDAGGEERLTPELTDYKRLQEISGRLIPTDNIGALYEELVAAAIDLTGADGGTMQSLDEATGKLRLLVAQGLPERVIDTFARVTPELCTSCAKAMQRGERVIISDYATDEECAGTESARKHLEAGIRAVQSTPLIARSGQMVGILSTHWNQPHEPDERKLQLLDILARQAADLIEQRRSEQALCASEKRYRTLFNSIDEGFCVIEVLFNADEEPVDFRYLETNPAFEEHTGLRSPEGERARALVPDVEERWFEIYGEVARTGEPVRLDCEAESLDRHFDLYAFRIGDPVEQKVAVLFSDITDRKGAEAALRESEERLRELNRSLEERVEKRTAELEEQTQRLRHLATELASAEQRERRRLAALLHDELQQLLYGAEMQLSMVRDQADEGSIVAAAIDEASERIGEAVEAARSLTCQLRPPALYEAGLTPALKWLVSEMAERHGLKVVVDAGEVDTTAARRALDDDLKAMLFEWVRELLFNVVNHAGVDEARVALQTGMDSSDTGGSDTIANNADRLRLIVEDEGRGFDVEAVSRDDARDDGGFGLFSIRERIVALEGSMRVESSPGEGTRIELAVPLAAAASGEQAWSSALGAGRDESEPAAAAGHAQMRVVIADDHAVVRQGIANLLTEDERTVVVGEAADGAEAVEAVEQHRPDAVLMDVNMPRMNGVEATEEIRRRWPETIVVGMSVQADGATEKAMLDAGAAAFVPKSGDAERVIETILRVTERSSQTRA